MFSWAVMSIADCRDSEYNHKKLLQAFKKVGASLWDEGETDCVAGLCMQRDDYQG